MQKFDSEMKPLQGIPSQIGNTGLIRLSHLFPEKEVYGKLELMNPAGSIKDRTSKFVIEESLRLGLITKDSWIVESTSGNMGIGLAQVCLYYGIKLRLVVDPFINRQTLLLLKAYHAEIEMVNEKDQGGSYLNTRIKRVQELLQELPNAFWTRQYENELNPLTHHQTAKEIVAQLGIAPDYILAATSTCGTLMGLASYCHENRKGTKVIPVDAQGSVIFGGNPGKRVIPGFGASRKSSLLDTNILEPPLIMEEWESIVGCKKLLDREAILAGGSTGALVSAIDKMDLVPGQKAVIILCDRGERYLETIYSEPWIEKTYGKDVLTKINQAVYEDLVPETVC